MRTLVHVGDVHPADMLYGVIGVGISIFADDWQGRPQLAAKPATLCCFNPQTPEVADHLAVAGKFPPSLSTDVQEQPFTDIEQEVLRNGSPFKHSQTRDQYNTAPIIHY